MAKRGRGRPLRRKDRKPRKSPKRGKLSPTVVAEEKQRRPPADLPDTDICSAFSAASQLGVYTSAVTKAITDGLLDGGVYSIRGRVEKIWWVSLRDLREVLRRGGWRGSELRHRRYWQKYHDLQEGRKDG